MNIKKDNEIRRVVVERLRASVLKNRGDLLAVARELGQTQRTTQRWILTLGLRTVADRALSKAERERAA